MVWPRLIALTLAASAAAPAAGLSYCCTDEGGHRICGDVLPTQCFRKAYQEINHQGKIVREVEGPLTPEQRAQREAEQARQKAAQRAADEQRRKDQALRISYASTKDIDAKRDRVLAEAEANLKLARERYEEAQERKKHLETEMEFYTKKEPPARLTAQIRETQAELDKFESSLAARNQEMDDIRNRFEEEKRRYLAITGRSR